MAIASINPATGETLRTFEPHTSAEVERRVALAAGLFPRWRATSFAERAARLLRAADLLESRKQEWGRIMTLEMGKPIGAAIAEAEKCAWVCRYYAENGERFLADEPVDTDAPRSYVRYEPLGPVLAVMPWNFPFWQVFRFAAPALMAGNVGLLKHASNVPQCALAIEEIFREAGFPDGVFQTLLIGSDRVAPLIDDPGSPRSRSPAARARASPSAARRAPRSRRPCSSSAAAIRSSSCPAPTSPRRPRRRSRRARINNGQSCIAAKRFIVHQEVAAEFERLFVARMAALKVGDPPRSDRRDRPARDTRDRGGGGRPRAAEHRRGREAAPAGASAWSGRATSTPRPCWPTFRREARPPSRRSSGRSRASSA